MREVVGACPLDCPDGCSWVVTVDDEDVPVKLRGNPDHPFTQGGLCVKLNPYLDYVQRPDRFLHPLRRVGAKGEGRFERISWDDALDEIAERFQATIDTVGAPGIWPFVGTGSVGFVQGASGGGARRFFHALGASRHAVTICSPAGHVGMSYTTGSAYGLNPEDIVHSGVVVLWGTNTLTSNQHLWPYVERARANGAEIVVVDPLATRTAKRSDRHIAPMPGTDGALALGLMAEIVRLDGTDEDWLDAHAAGWPAFRDGELAQWNAARAAAICQIDATEITDLAELVIARGPLAIRSSMGMQRHAGGGQAMRVVSCLPAITGAYGVHGGGMCYSSGAAYDFDMYALTRPDLQPVPARSLAATQMAHNLLDLDDPPVNALMVWAANPAMANPDERRVREGLSRDDLFTVVVEHGPTATTDYADIVLPGTMQIEHNDLHDSFSHTYVQWNPKVVDPPGECWSHTEIFRALAERMGLSDPAVFASDEELARAALEGPNAGPRTVAFDTLVAKGWAQLEGIEDLPFAGGFPTPGGRFLFENDRAETDGFGRFPKYVAPAEAVSGPAGTLALLSPANHYVLNSTFAGFEKHARAGAATVELHPDDAADLGHVDGQSVDVGNDRGSFTAMVVISDTARPGVAATTKGRPGDPTTVNATVPERDADMGRGAVYHDNRVTITAVNSGADGAVEITPTTA